ncbi:MAG: hypothetical protein LBU70_05685 [Chitinispirillales bacterium]|jgi:ligand-binding sensor domain-containing protein|nr:hypothetical protein [Chitinispirillales bacterium]
MLKIKRVILAATLALGLAASAGYAQRADSVSFEVPPVLTTYPSNAPVRAFTVHQNSLWFAGPSELFMQPLNSQNTQSHSRMGDISAAGITGIVLAPDGRIWIGGSEGVAVRAGNNFTSYTAEHGLPAGAVTAVGVGGNGDVWVGTENGAARLRSGTWTQFTTEQGLPSNKVQAIAITPGGRAFIGTDRGIGAYDGTAFKVFNMRGDEGQNLSSNNVRILTAEPQSETIWAAVGAGSVNKYENGRWTQFMVEIPGITSIAYDLTTRRVWFGSTGREPLMRFNGEEWTSQPSLLGIQATEVHSLFVDPAGGMWFGMRDNVTSMTRPRR